MISDPASSMFENISTGKVQVRHGLLQFADLNVQVIALASSISAMNTEIFGIKVMELPLIENSISFNSRIGRNMMLQHRWYTSRHILRNSWEFLEDLLRRTGI